MRLFRIAIAILLLLLLPKLGVALYATQKREEIQARILAANSQTAGAQWFASWLAREWQHETDPKPVWRRLRSLMPRPFKPGLEATEFLSMQGTCTDMVRVARWALDGALPSNQHDIITPHTAHSAISVQIEKGKWVLLDPFLGMVFRDRDGLLGLGEVIARAKEGIPARTFAVPLVAEPDFELYDEVDRASHAPMPLRLDTTIALPVDGKPQWSIGELDGKTRDTQLAAKRLGLTTHFFYVGPRFSRQFRFTYTLPHDGRAYEITFHLTREVEEEELPEFSVAPDIGDKTLTFRLPPGTRALTVDSSNPDLDAWYGLDKVVVTAHPVRLAGAPGN